MTRLSVGSMRGYLRTSISSTKKNKNKLRGLLAEVELRAHLSTLGFGDSISPGGWIMRSVGPGTFGHHPTVVFPELLLPGSDYAATRAMPTPPPSVQAAAEVFRRIGVATYFCAAQVGTKNACGSLTWRFKRLGLATDQPWTSLEIALSAFPKRTRRYGYLRYKTDLRLLADSAVPEEFAKEHLRVSIGTVFRSEGADVDGIFYGRQVTYPVEIKEKTRASDPKGLGDYFGLDVQPFTKLAFYAAAGNDLSSLFIVREINNTKDRKLVAWHCTTFTDLAKLASWQPIGGGTNMRGGASTVVRIPLEAFKTLNATNLGAL